MEAEILDESRESTSGDLNERQENPKASEHIEPDEVFYPKPNEQTNSYDKQLVARLERNFESGYLNDEVIYDGLGFFDNITVAQLFDELEVFVGEKMKAHSTRALTHTLHQLQAN